MKKLLLLLSFILVSQIAAHAQTPIPITLKDSARIFGKDVISTGDFVFNASFTPDNKTVFFSKSTINFGYIGIFYSVKNGSGWSAPKPVDFTGVYRDTDPFVSADGKRLYFASDRPLDGQPFKDYDYHFYYVTLDGNKVTSKPVLFTLPVPAGPSPSYLSFADNGNAYFFISDGKIDAEMYVCKLKDGKYQPAEKLPFNDAKFIDFDPMIAHDESFIIFCSPNRKGIGANDLWVSFKKDTTWTEPQNLGPKVNTTGADGAPGLSRDDKTLYFLSSREHADRPVYPGGKVTTETFDKLLHSTKNGMRIIYEIDISDINHVF